MAIKRVGVEELRAGMYVHDLNCGWLQHGFLRQQFMLRQPGQIQKMKDQGLKEIYIDTDLGEDVPGALTQTEIERGLDRQLKDSAAGGAALAQARVSQKEESAAAKRILGEATDVMEGLLLDVRLGKQVDVAQAGPLVKEINASVLRNPGALLSLCRIKEADTYTFQHSVSICALLVSFTHALGMDDATVHEAGFGGLLHDVGKMKIPSEHHEKMDGGGYPRGISGAEISQIGRMAAIVDVYDALTSNRVYHKGMEPSEVLKKLLEWSGSHLDGELVQQFIRTLGIYPVGSLVRLSGGRLAVVVEQGEDLLRPTVRVVYDTGRKTRLQPRDLHLAHATEQIVDYEDPAEWGLDATSYF